MNSKDVVNENTICQICSICWLELNQINNKIPSKCAGNNMWLGDIPIELQELTLPEQHLIALYRHNQCIIKIESVYHSVETQQSKLKGNCISVSKH